MTEAATKTTRKSSQNTTWPSWQIFIDFQVPGDFEGNSWVMPHDIFMEVLTGFILCVLQLSLATLGLQANSCSLSENGGDRINGVVFVWQLTQNMMINTMIVRGIRPILIWRFPKIEKMGGSPKPWVSIHKWSRIIGGTPHFRKDPSVTVSSQNARSLRSITAHRPMSQTRPCIRRWTTTRNCLLMLWCYGLLERIWISWNCITLGISTSYQLRSIKIN